MSAPQRMTGEQFFALFLDELRSHPSMQEYYKFLANERSFYFRKHYFLSRLEYIYRHAGPTDQFLWDAGCGYGTTALFLALNGRRVHGSTLEMYFKEIPQRIEYWSRFGPVENFTFAYENIFGKTSLPMPPTRIIVQDTLHHLEPISDALSCFSTVLPDHGKLILVEENGQNLLQRARLYLRRGNRRIITTKDEFSGRDILMGNENIRSINTWTELFIAQGFSVRDVEYIRYYLPGFWNADNYKQRSTAEKTMWKQSPLRRKYLYFGLNFIAEKQLREHVL